MSQGTWKEELNKDGNRTLKTTITQSNGKKVDLYSMVETRYQRNTETGEIRASTNENWRSAHYIEVGNALGKAEFEKKRNVFDDLPTAKRLNNGNYVVLAGYQDPDGKMRSNYVDSDGNTQTLAAGADLRRDYAEYNAGKPAEYTNSLLERASKSTTAHATFLNQNEEIVDTDIAGLPLEDARGDTKIVRTSSEESGDEEEVEITLKIDKDPVAITKKRGVLGFKEGEFETLKYPDALLNEDTDYLLIMVKEYQAIGGSLIRSRGQFDSTKGNRGEKHKGAIILPIPSDIQDGNSVKYGDGSLDGITAAAAGAALGVIQTDINITNPSKTFNDAAEAITSNFEGKLGDMRSVYTRSIAAQAANLLQISPVTREQLLARESGGILNPNTELLFSGVTLRSFKFSFKMTPRNETEAKVIKRIIRVFKSNMAPKSAGNFLSTPNVFDLSYMSGSSPHPFLHSFKTCALTDMNVNYTGEGVYATYGGTEKSPISMVMDLTFKELEAIYDEDYDDSTNVGY